MGNATRNWNGIISWVAGQILVVFTNLMMFFFVNCQTITMPPSGSLDLMRTLRMAGYGLFILGFLQHTWFNFLGRVLPKRDIFTTLKKIVVGQLVFGPLTTSIFFTYNATLQGTYFPLLLIFSWIRNCPWF